MSGIETVLANSLTWTAASTILDEKDATDIFAALINQTDGLAELSNQFLQTGIDYYTNEEYEKAAQAFEASIAIDSDSDYNTQATQYLAQTYLKLEKTGKAIETYEKSIQRNGDDATLRTSLAQLYYMEERYDDAAFQYGKAVEIDDNAENRYSYGEALLKIEDYEEAEVQFNKVKNTYADSTAGYYGLGKMYSLLEAYDKAIEEFEAALEIDPEFYDAMAEIGYAYADMGEYDAATEVFDELEGLDEDLADTLETYIYQSKEPEIAFAYATSSFPYKMTADYAVSAIDSYLENAGAELSMTMTFQFTKDMDISSVLDRTNWTIARASSNNIAKTYNYGDEIPSTEISLDYTPDYVIYDSDTCTATLGFTVRQNETADGTIDPSHIVFTFDGEDVYGVSMSADADEYSGFSGSA